jgi:hypothetical protein
VNQDGNPKYKYYYYDADSVAASMRKVAKSFRSGAGTGDDGLIRSDNKEGNQDDEEMEDENIREKSEL